jgi:hypothetical protein
MQLVKYMCQLVYVKVQRLICVKTINLNQVFTQGSVKASRQLASLGFGD